MAPRPSRRRGSAESLAYAWPFSWIGCSWLGCVIGVGGWAAGMGAFLGRGAKERWIPWVEVEVVRPAGRNCRSTIGRIGVPAAKKRCRIVSTEM
jgi:hypothetical protein